MDAPTGSLSVLLSVCLRHRETSYGRLIHISRSAIDYITHMVRFLLPFVSGGGKNVITRGLGGSMIGSRRRCRAKGSRIGPLVRTERSFSLQRG